ncbi:MAG: hypothetical protein ACLP05_03195 [Candidatus Kryptoniota bacterium]
MKHLFILIIVTVQLSNVSLGQCPQYDLVPPHLHILIKCLADLDPSTGIFQYTYSITNLNDSKGCVDGIDIDVTYPSLGVELSNEGLLDSKHVWRDPLADSGALKIIPVGIPSLPRSGDFTSTWWAGFGEDGHVSWTSADDMFRIAPGMALNGFVMTSHGIPGLRAFVVSPSYNPKPPVEITPENEQTIPEQTEEQDSIETALENSIKVRGWTIGPTAPPQDFSASSWIDTLISYKHQSVTLGWLTDNKACKPDCDNIMIGRDWFMQGDFQQYDKWSPDNSWNFDRDWNNGIVEVLDTRLDKAKIELSRKDSTDARQDLEIFVMEVEMLNDVNKKLEGGGQKSEVGSQKSIMTSEAYALLKYNAEYLIDRLPEGRQRH